MAYAYHAPIHILPAGVETVKGGESRDVSPFAVSIINNSPNIQVKVSRFSAILKSPNIKDKLNLIGVNVPMDIQYGDKIWLEIFYDRNLSPVFGLINYGKKWGAQTYTPSGSVDVYPNELELITKNDLSSKIDELGSTTSLVNDVYQKAYEEITDEFRGGFITQSQQDALHSGLQAAFNVINDNIIKYKQDMNQFFVAAPNATYKKLFRSYTLIAYTTKDMNGELEGLIARPPNIGSPSQGGVNTSTEDASFKIVQTLATDLLLADICHQNRYPAKLPIPYHRAPYYFVYDGKEEV